jgi:hypothetical protein
MREGNVVDRTQQVTKLFDKRLVLVKLGLIMTNYTSELVTERLRPNPDMCKFISVSEMAALAKEDPSSILNPT